MARALELRAAPRIVVKVGSSSIIGGGGAIDTDRIARLTRQLVAARGRGAQVVLVSSGAVAAGMPILGFERRPDDMVELQALAAVGQVALMDAYSAAFATHDVRLGQILLTKHDFAHRSQYIHARSTLRRLLDLGVLPVANENDTVAVDEIRFGENDRLSALVANLVDADLLMLLTDQPGVYSSDPRISSDATLIDEIHDIDAEVEAAVASDGGPLGSGGMASKLAAAKMARWSGIPTLIAQSDRDDVLEAVMASEAPGTLIHPQSAKLSSRKLWIAFAQHTKARIAIDAGAAKALRTAGSSLLAVGVTGADERFDIGDAIEICDPDAGVVAKGLARVDVDQLEKMMGSRAAPVVVHRDDMVVFH